MRIILRHLYLSRSLSFSSVPPRSVPSPSVQFCSVPFPSVSFRSVMILKFVSECQKTQQYRPFQMRQMVQTRQMRRNRQVWWTEELAIRQVDLTLMIPMSRNLQKAKRISMILIMCERKRHLKKKSN